MKRLMQCLLACLMLLSVAQAQQDALLEHDETFFAADLLAAGDTLYWLAELDGGAMTITSWQRGQADVTVAKTPVNYALYMQLTEAVPVDDGSRIVTMLFTDGRRLMSFDPVLGVIFEMELEGEHIVYRDVATVSDPASLYWDEYGYAKALMHAAVSGDILYWLTSEWDDSGVQHSMIQAIDLRDGSVSQLPMQDVTDFELLPDQRLLILQGTSALAYYDPSDGDLQPIAATLPMPVYDILHAPSVGAVAYLENQRVMGLDDGQNVTQYAYSPVEPIDAAIMGDSIAITDGTITVLRPLAAGYQPEHELTVMSGGYENRAAVRRYAATHPDTAVYWYQDHSGYLFDQSYEALVPLLKENQLDIAVVTVNASGFSALAEDGYCADVTGYDELVKRLNSMHPAFRDAATVDGRYVAVPLSASSWGWYYDPDVLQKTGIAADELPTNLIDLCAFVTRWNNELMTRYPDVALFAYVENTRSYVLGAMMEQYAVWCEKQHGMLTFDTEEFRSLLAAVSEMECDQIDRAAANHFYEGGLIGNDFASVGSFEWAEAEQYGMAMRLPMALNADMAPLEPVVLEVAFVNADCDAPSAAAQLLVCMLDSLPVETAYTLFEDAKEPVINPDYPALHAAALAELDRMTAERDTAGKSAGEYDEMIAAQQYYIDDELPQLQWLISHEDIAFYQEKIAPWMHVIRANCISDWLSPAYAECYALLERYARAEITSEQLIRELNSLR